jgi:hypothetical protein
MAKPRKPARKRSQETGTFEPPWSGYRKQLEMQAAAMSAEELAEAQRLAALLVSEGLPAGWLVGNGEVAEIEEQGELFG